jgi:hypothetical protein
VISDGVSNDGATPSLIDLSALTTFTDQLSSTSAANADNQASLLQSSNNGVLLTPNLTDTSGVIINLSRPATDAFRSLQSSNSDDAAIERRQRLVDTAFAFTE